MTIVVLLALVLLGFFFPRPLALLAAPAISGVGVVAVDQGWWGYGWGENWGLAVAFGTLFYLAAVVVGMLLAAVLRNPEVRQ